MKVLIPIEMSRLVGPSRNLLDALALIRDEVSPRFVTFLRGQAKTSEFVEGLRSYDFPVEILRERFRYDPSTITQFRNLVATHQPDLIQVHNTKSRMILAVSRVDRSIPRVTFFHGETWVDSKQGIYNAIDRRLFKRASHVVVIAQPQANILASWGVKPEKISVIPNGIEIPDLPERTEHGHRLLCVGRLSAEKGQHLLLDALKLLADSGVKDFHLDLVGDGPELEALQKKAEAAGLQELVTFAGYQSDPGAYYRKADLFVLPSLSEGFPNVLLEAAAFGVPFIAFSVGGIPWVFEHEREALILPKPGAEDLATAIHSFLFEPQSFRERAERARKRVERDFSMRQKADALLELYRSYS